MYAKVFRTLFYGSLTGQSDAQLVFICLITHCDRDGTVELPPNIIAGLTGLPAERVQSAIELLEAPDEKSRSKDHDGRRLEPFGFARWNVVNFMNYRAIRDEDDRRQQNRLAKQRQRLSAKVSQGQPPSAHTEADTDTDTDKEETPLFPNGNGTVSAERAKPVRTRLTNQEPVGFAQFYQAYPRHDARRAAAKAFGQALKRHPTYDASHLLHGAQEYAKKVEKEGRSEQYIAMPATWLNEDRFREYFDEDDDA